MNKLLFHFSIIFVLLNLACDNDEINEVYKDYRFKTKVIFADSTNLDNLYLNGTLPVHIEIEKNDPHIGKYHFSYMAQQGKGMLWYKDSLLTPGFPVTINEEKLVPLKYIPITSGIHNVIFNLKNEKFNVSNRFVSKVERLYFQLKTNNLPLKFLIDKPSVFDLELITPEEENIRYKTHIQFLEGAGKVQILNNQDTISREASDYLIKGYNKIYFTGVKQGFNNLRFTLFNKYSLSQTIDIPLNVEYPEYSVTILSDSVVKAGKNNFVLKVDNTDQHPANQYWVTYRPLMNSGALSINNNTLESGNMLEVKAGDNICEFTPHNLGTVLLEFILRDKYSTIKKDTVAFNVVKSETELKISNFLASCAVFEPQFFNLAINKKNYAGQFKIEILQEPSIFLFSLNGIDYKGGRIPVINKDNTLISFIAQKTGSAVITLRIYDDYGSCSEKILNLNIRNSTGKINISNLNPAASILSPTSFNFSVSKPKYEGSFQCEITSEPVVAGILKINNKTYTGGKIGIENPDNTLVTFTPQVLGEVKLTIRVYDKFGGTINREACYIVSNTDIQLVVNNLESKLIIGKPTHLNLSPIKPGYSGNLLLEILATPEDAGYFSVDGREYVSGIREVRAGDPLDIAFHPYREGEIRVEVIVSDEFGGKKTRQFHYSVTNPEIEAEISDFKPSAILGSETYFYVTTKKQYYQDPFFYNITTNPTNAGTIRVNDTLYTENTRIPQSSNPVKISFIPRMAGSILLNLNISDNAGKQTYRELEYSVTTYPAILTIMNHETGLTIDKPTSFNFSVSQKNYTGTFLFDITTEPVVAGSLLVDGKEYNGGKTQIANPDNTRVTFTPSFTGEMKLSITVYDSQNVKTTKELNYFVKNSPLNLMLSNLENQIFLGKETEFNLNVIKENYNKTYKYEISLSPENSGKVFVNGSSYTGGKQLLTAPDNTIVKYIPEIPGINTLTIVIYDDNGDKTEKTVYFNSLNPPVTLSVNNPTTNLITGQLTRFSIKAGKENYAGNYKYEITQYPYASGEISVGGENSIAGTLTSEPTEITYKPLIVGNTTLKIDVKDEWGGHAEKQIDFNITDTPLSVNITNQEDNVILNRTTTFNLSVIKENYADNQNIFYSISPAKYLTIDNKPYNGGTLQIKYADIKKGIPISYMPARAGANSLSVYVYDEYRQNVQKTINFNTSNPELNVFLSGINESVSNPVNLNETFKFTLNVNKEYYTDDFAYWITVNPADAALLATSDITPRTRTSSSNGTITGTISSSPFGMSSVEIRLTPNNEIYLNREIRLDIRVRDKWENEVIKTVTLRITTSTINLNVVRNSTSIPVLNAYQFYFTVSKPNYTGNFKFSIVGASDEDILEISNDGTKFTPYKGGKYELTTPDHTYIRYTPYNIGTIPLLLFVYDDNGSYIEKNISFDVRAPQVVLSGGGIKSGITNEFIPFSLTATEEQNNDMNIRLNVDNELDGIVLFNETNVYNSLNRSVLKKTPLTIHSGQTNNLKMMSRQKGKYHTEIEVSNIWNNTASVTSTINVSEPSSYTLTINKRGEGEVTINPLLATYTAGSLVQIIAKPAIGYEFGGWGGDLSGTSLTQSIQMNSNKIIEATFIKKPTEKIKLNFSVEGNITPPDNEQKIINFGLIIYETATNKTIYNSNIYFPLYPEYPLELNIDRTLDYTIVIDIRAKNFDNITNRTRYELKNITFEFSQSNGNRITDSSTSSSLTKEFNIRGSVLCDTKQENILKGMAIYDYHYY